jgi:hypothetical protein
MAGIPVTIVGEIIYTGLSVGGGPMPGGPYPSHPIAPGGPPLAIWGGAPPTYPDIGFPTPQPPFPQPPKPPVIWGGPIDPYPDIGLPSPQPKPPFVLWGPIGDYIDAGFPAPQPPLPPIVNDRPVDWRIGWTPTTGWIVVGIPTGPHPTPSKK